jgi:pilus assembly protein CpaB
MKRRSGLIWIGTGVILAVLAGLLALWVIMRATADVAVPEPPEPKVEVVVASRFIDVRALIRSGDVETRAAPLDIVPEDAARSVEEVVDHVALTPLSPGQMILTSQVVSPTIKGRHIAFIMEEDQVVMAYAPGDLMSGIGLLESGDHVDLLFSLEVGGEGAADFVTFYSLQNLEIARIVRETTVETVEGVQRVVETGKPLAFLFALDPQDALVLKHLKDEGAVLDMVLRAPGVEVQFDTQPVNMDYLIDLYRLRIPIAP